MDSPALQVNAEFALAELRKVHTEELELRRLVRKELCRLAEVCYLEDVYVLPFMDELLDKVKEECAKFKSGPREFYPDPRHNVLKIQMHMPSRGKVGVIFWGSKVVV